MSRWKFLISLTAIIAVAWSWGVPPWTGTASAEALDDIKKRGKMVVAIDPTFAPFEYTGAGGKIVGYDPAVLEAIAANLGVEIEYQVMGFSGIIRGLIAGSFDFTPTALAVRKERAEKIDFTIPVAATVHAIMKRAGDAKITDSNPESLSGLKVAVKQTTAPETLVQEYNVDLKSKGLKPAELLSIETVEQTVTALVNKRVDVIVDDLLVLAQVIKERPDAGLEIVGNIGPMTYVSWGTNKGDPKLNALLNEQISALKQSGKLAALQKQHFGVTFDDLPEKDFVPK